MEPAEDANMDDGGNEHMDNALLLVQQMFADKIINDVQRDQLKEMIFDEDAILMSFFARYDIEAETDDLKGEVLKYIGASIQKVPVEEQNTTTDSLEGMSSPMDSAVDMKKRRRMKALKAELDKEDAAKEGKSAET